MMLCRMLNSCFSTLFLLLFISTTIVVEARARTKSEVDQHRLGHFRHRDRFQEICSLIKFTFALVFLPTIISFVVSLARDPATPIIFRALCRRLKRKIFGNISSMEKKKEAFWKVSLWRRIKRKLLSIETEKGGYLFRKVIQGIRFKSLQNNSRLQR